MAEDALGRPLRLGALGGQDVRTDLVGGQADQSGGDLHLLLDVVGQILGGGHRLDYAGGVSGNAFFLRNGGYFSDRVPANQAFTRPATPARKPEIDFPALEKP